jgi:tripartite-type tricarboxylate transporter receptor subunit TctC
MAATATAIPTLKRTTWAQTYPSRPITMIVPYGAGGPTDTIARIIAEGMRKPLGQPIIIENIAGASATIGVGRVVRAPSDGYTVGIGNWASQVLNGAVFTLPYDLLQDFAPVAQIASDPQVIIARQNMPANSLSELIAWLRANPDKGTQGTGGAGPALRTWSARYSSNKRIRAFSSSPIGLASAQR